MRKSKPLESLFYQSIILFFQISQSSSSSSNSALPMSVHSRFLPPFSPGWEKKYFTQQKKMKCNWCKKLTTYNHQPTKKSEKMLHITLLAMKLYVSHHNNINLFLAFDDILLPKLFKIKILFGLMHLYYRPLALVIFF